MPARRHSLGRRPLARASENAHTSPQAQFSLDSALILNRLIQPFSIMPNQLSRLKKRKTLAEHVAVLAMLEQIAAREGTTSTELIREAARGIVRKNAQNSASSENLRNVLSAYIPKPPSRIRRAKELSRYKKECREFDELTMDLGLNDAVEVQQRNSIHRMPDAPVLIGRL